MQCVTFKASKVLCLTTISIQVPDRTPVWNGDGKKDGAVSPNRRTLQILLEFHGIFASLTEEQNVTILFYNELKSITRVI